MSQTPRHHSARTSTARAAVDGADVKAVPPTPRDARPGDRPVVSPRPLARGVWIALGLVGCGLGGVGIVVPGMPATVFFIFAAFCFSRSSPRLLNWVLNLPRVGPLVRDYRAGLGMPRKAKIAALTMMAVFGGISLVTIPKDWIRVLVFGLLVIGACTVWWAVPTRKE